MRVKLSLRVFSGVAQREICASLAAAGVEVVEDSDSDLLLAVADDYVHRGLAAVNRDAMDRKRPWLLCKVVGPSLWAGPFFRPRETACWACLRHRLVENRWREHELWRAGGVSHVDASRVHPGFEAAFWQWLALEVIRFYETARCELDGQVVTFEPNAPHRRTHAVFRRLDCLACMSLGVRERRTRSTVETRIERNYSEITGIVSDMAEVAGPEWRPIHVRTARSVLPLDARAPLLGTPPELVVGRGVTEADATLACLAEGCERYSAFYQGNEELTRARYKEIADRAVHPRDLSSFSERQYARRNREPSIEGREVPVPFDENQPVDWVEAVSLERDSRWIPAAYCYLRHLEPAHPFCVADSNGCAAGKDFDSAVENGLYELIERDAAAIWWYNRLPAPSLPFETFDDEFLRRVPQLFAANGRSVWLLRLPTDWRVPVVAALCCTRDESSIHYAFAAGASLTRAARSATTELVQTLLSYERLRARSPDDPRVQWIERTTLADRPFLRPHDPVNLVRMKEMSPGALLQRSRELNLEVLTVDLSRPEVDVPVARTIVAGMRSLMPRFGPGRLYELPVTLGLRADSLAEEELSSDPVL